MPSCSTASTAVSLSAPSSSTPPYNTTHLGARIARDTSNQYFIATHNPYLLVAVLEKANKTDVAVFATRYRKYQTEVTMLSEDQLSRLLEADPFLGLESVVEEG